MRRIMVTGSNGMLGQELQAYLNTYPFAEAEWTFTTRDQINLEQLDQIPAILQEIKPDILINLAAYTQVDQAESDQDAAHQINAVAPGKLAQYCQALNCRLIHISTDYVYGGAGNTPFGESAILAPQGVYAKTKALGEQHILDHAPDALIIRTSWLYGPFGNNFLKTMLKLGRDKDKLQVVNDQIGTPTYTFDLAKVLVQICSKILLDTEKKLGGIYNFSNEGTASWFDFAWAIMDYSGLSCTLSPVPTTAFPRPAPRPAFSLMSKEKICSTFGIIIPHWQDGLRRCLKLLN